MEPKYNNAADVREDYRHTSQQLIDTHPRASVLKTDCFNEAEPLNVKSIAGRLTGFDKFVCVDVDEPTVRIAQEKLKDVDGVCVQLGDIRDLAFADATFDVVLDLSTIDHVPPGDVIKVLDEYSRVAKCDADILVISWLDQEMYVPAPPWPHGHQYVFDASWFTALLKERFVIEREELLFVWKVSPLPQSQLWKFSLKKRLSNRSITTNPLRTVYGV